MNCPKCEPSQQKGSRVIETRLHRDGRMLRRRRECLSDAGHRFTTYETVVEPNPPEIELPNPKRKRMPRERQSITHQFSIAGHEGYVTAGMYEDGTVGEILLTELGKEGSTVRGMMHAFATSISLSLQHGVPLETLVQKYSYMRFEPEGITANPEIPFAKSVPDYVMRWLASRFLDTDQQEELGILTPAVRERTAVADAGKVARRPTPRPASRKTKPRRTQDRTGPRKGR